MSKEEIKEKVADDKEQLPEGVEMIDYSEDAPSDKPAKKKMKLWRKILLTVCIVVLVLSLVLLGGFFYLRASGKKSLYGNATSEKPNLVQALKETESHKELEINPDQMDDIEENPDIENPSQGSEGESQTTGNATSGGQQDGGEAQEKEEPIDIQEGDGVTHDVVYKGEKYLYNKDMINMLILGIDKTTTVSKAEDGISGGQSDALFLLTLNPDTKVMDIIAIPRDMIAYIDVYDKSGNYVQSGYAQICLQHGYGDGMQLSNERAKQAVSKMFYDLPIHSVTSVNMGAIADLNDAIGGVTLQSLHTFSYKGYSFTEGETVTLKGQEAYHYVHYRDIYRHYTAPERLERQKQYITKLVNTTISQLKSDVGLIADVYSIVQDYVVTDLGINDMTYLGSELVKYRFGKIYNLEGRIDTTRKYERFYVSQSKFYALIIDHFYEKVE